MHLSQKIHIFAAFPRLRPDRIADHCQGMTLDFCRGESYPFYEGILMTRRILIMKILALYGSPHKPQSNSSYLLDTILDEIGRAGGHQILKYNLAEMTIGTCINCGVCRKPDQNGCFQKDDMETVAAAIAEADYIFMASPLYWWNISASLKACIDRFYGIPFACFKDKTIHLVMAGQSETSNEGYRLVKNTMRCVTDYIGAHLETFFAAASLLTIPAWNNETLIGQAKAVARKF